VKFSSRITKSQDVHFALVWPIFRSGDHACLDRVFPQIKPLLMVALPVPQTPVKKISLPDWLFFPIRPPAIHLTAPESCPGCDWRSRSRRWGAEQMQMVRHRYPASDQPAIGLLPAFQKQGRDLGPRQERTSLVHTHRHKDHSRLIGKFQGRKMWQNAAARVWVIHR